MDTTTRHEFDAAAGDDRGYAAAAAYNQALAAEWMRAHDSLLAWVQARPEFAAALAEEGRPMPDLPSRESTERLAGAEERERKLREALAAVLDLLGAFHQGFTQSDRRIVEDARALLKEE